MTSSVMNTLIFVTLPAAFLAIASAAFGAGMARLLWADDLQHAQQIDEIRSKTEVALRRQINALEGRIKILAPNETVGNAP